MSSHEFVRLLVELAVMLFCALAGGWIMRHLRQPAVLGEMIAGIVIGPTIFGAIAPDWQGWLFSESGGAADVRGGVIKMGMLFFLFVVGLEIDLGQFRKYGFPAVLIGVIGTMVPLGCGVAIVYLLPADMLPAHVGKLPFGLFIGTTLANTANPVLARILLDLGLLRDDLGAMLMTATIVDDLVTWSLVAVILESVETPGAAAHYGSVASSLVVVAMLLVAALLIGRFIAMPLLQLSRRGTWPTSFISATVVLVLASAAASEYLGIHAFLGPFLLGLGIAATPRERSEAYEVLNQFALSFFVPIYFVSMGLTADFITDFDAWWVGSILIVACVSKIGSAYVAARLAGLGNRTALAIGAGMNARGATGIILAGVGLENGVVNKPIYVALVVMSIVTSLAAGPLITWALPAHGSKTRIGEHEHLGDY